MHYVPGKDRRRSVWNRIFCSCFTIVLFLQLTASVAAQVDPGIRGGAPGAGQPFPGGLTAGELAFFNDVGVVEFTVVTKHVRVRVCSNRERALVDACADQRRSLPLGGASG